MAIVETRWKRADSPNVAGSCWGYSLNGRFVEHDEENIFEAPPIAVTQCDLRRFGYRNSKYQVMYESAWFRLDTNNDTYSIDESY